jgi:hypothetical protein
LFAQEGNRGANDVTARFAHDIAEEDQFHWRGDQITKLLN